jgi:antitoxin component YwqK of YwqJK toxin-antitoxin module
MLLEKELAGYEQTKGSIHFAIDKRFPKPLLRKIIKARISQINASYPKRTGEYHEFYANGVLKAKGKMKNEQLHGDWKWFRRDGVIMRSGSFKNGKQTGIWITYDQKGKPHKKTNFGS